MHNMSKNVLRTLLIFSYLTLNQNAFAQQTDSDTSKINPDILATSSCVGHIVAGALYNYKNEIISESESRAMVRSAFIAYYLSALDYEDLDHVATHEDTYVKIRVSNLKSTFVSLHRETFDRAKQAELDKCTALITKQVMSVSARELFKYKLEDYFSFIDNVIKMADRQFNSAMPVLSNMTE